MEINEFLQRERGTGIGRAELLRLGTVLLFIIGGLILFYHSRHNARVGDH